MSHSAQNVSNESRKKNTDLVEAIKDGDIIYTINDRMKLVELAKESVMKYGTSAGDRAMALINVKQMNRKSARGLQQAVMNTASKSTNSADKFLAKKHDGDRARADLAVRYYRMKAKQAAKSSQ